MIRALPVASPAIRRRPSPRGGTFIVAISLAVAAAACGPAGPTTGPSGSGSPTSSSSASPSSGTTASPEPSSPELTPTPAPTPVPTPSSAGTSGSSAACFGSADTKDFFTSFAESVPWPVYCAKLPSGWSVEKGVYRLRNGGRLTISYRRRAEGMRIVLDEGALCVDGTGCTPSGSNEGTIPFADREAKLIDTASGYAAVVDDGENPSWLLTGTGIDQGDFTKIAAALHLIDR